MKKLNPFTFFIFAVIAAFSAPAYADGFVCGTLDRELQIQVYHSTNPAQGTRNVSVMILSDPTAPWGQQTIARMNRMDETLRNNGTSYYAQVLPPRPNTPETSYIGAISLYELRLITLHVHFSYTTPIPPGAPVNGVLVLQKLNGEQLAQDVSCIRYLKRPQ